MAGGGLKAGQGLNRRDFSAHGMCNIHKFLKRRIVANPFLIAIGAYLKGDV
jgi:hypothetical protein